MLPPARSYDLPSCDVQLYSTYDSNITISYPPVTGSSSLLPYIPESYRTAYPNATRSANGTCWDNPTLPELQQQQQNASTAADVSGQFAVVRCRCTNNQQDRNCYQDTQAIAWFYSLQVSEHCSEVSYSKQADMLVAKRAGTLGPGSGVVQLWHNACACPRVIFISTRERQLARFLCCLSQGPGTGPTEGSAADAFTFSPWWVATPRYDTTPALECARDSNTGLSTLTT